MEIRNVVNEVKNEYPKMGNVLSLSYTIDMDVAGGFPAHIPAPIRICNVACPIVSAVIFIVTGLSILLTKIKAKKQSEPKKVKKWIKILFIISIIVFIISVLTRFIGYIKNIGVIK